MSTPVAPPTTEPSSPSHSESTLESELLDDQKISAEDRKEILESIERVAAGHRIPAGDRLSQFKALKKGILFPLLINLIAAITVAAGIVGSNIYFSRKQADLSQKAGTFFSAEGLIVAQVKKQSAAKLKAKDREIASVKARLAKLNRESASLRSSMQSTIKAKERALKLEMSSQLAAEKARLEKLGITQSQVSNRMKAFENKKNSQLAAQIAQYKKKSESTLRERELQIQTQQKQTREALAKANRERQQILKQSQQQEAKLRARYEAQAQKLKSTNARLTARTTAAEKRLNTLAAKAQTEQLLSDQIVGSYGTILRDIQQTNYPQAEQDITSLSALLNSQKVNAIPVLAKRRPVDLELLHSLRELINARRHPGSAQVNPALLKQANEVHAAQKLVGQAKAAQKQGNGGKATALYRRAIAQVPIVEEAYKALTSIFDARQTAQASRRDKALVSLKKEAAAKNAEVARLKTNLGRTQEALKSAQSELTALHSKVNVQSRRIASLTRQLENSGGTAGTLKKQLAAAKAEVTRLDAKLAGDASSAASLRKDLAKERQAAATYRAQLAAKTKAAQGYRTQLIAATASAADLKKRLADNEKRVSLLQSNLAAAKSRITKLKSAASQNDGTVAAVQSDFASYKPELTRLIAAGSPSDIRKARTLLLQFMNHSGVDTLLPGFSPIAEQVSNSSSTMAEAKGRRSGRDQALQDVISVTDYFSSPGSSAQVQKTTIDRRAAHDPLYTQAAADIQKLAQKSGKATAHQRLAVGYKLIGTVSYISRNQITVEKLVSLPVKVGARVLIQRKDGHGGLVPIAEGKVTHTSSGSIEVSVHTLAASKSSPQLLDVVYLLRKSSG